MEVLPGSDLSDRVDRDAHLEGNANSLLWGMFRLRFMCDFQARAVSRTAGS